MAFELAFGLFKTGSLHNPVFVDIWGQKYGLHS